MSVCASDRVVLLMLVVDYVMCYWERGITFDFSLVSHVSVAFVVGGGVYAGDLLDAVGVSFVDDCGFDFYCVSVVMFIFCVGDSVSSRASFFCFPFF